MQQEYIIPKIWKLFPMPALKCSKLYYTENIFNLWSQNGNCHRIFSTYKTCIHGTAPVTTNIVRPKINDVLCRTQNINIHFMSTFVDSVDGFCFKLDNLHTAI